MLKSTIEDIQTVPEALRTFYEEQDGKYTLSVEGMVPKAKLDEFRANNINLARERDALRQQYEGIDPQKARNLLEKYQKEQDRKLIDAGKVDELLTQRVEAMRTDYESQLQTEAKKSQTLQVQLEGLLIDGAIRDEAAKAGIRSSAIEDVLLRGRSVFRLVEGKAVPMHGDDIIFDKTGEAMSMGEWLRGLATSAPHLFEPSRGAGAAGGASTSSMSGKFIDASDINGFINHLSDIARHNVRVG